MRHDYRAIDQTIRRYAGKRTLDQLRQKTGVSRSVVEARAARMGISLEATKPYRPDRIMSPDDLRLAHALRKDGMTYRELSEKFETHISTMHAALTGKTYKEVEL